MSDRLKELREKRGKLVKDMQALTDKVQAEKRDMSVEELKSHDDLFAAQDNLRKQAEAEERQAELARELAAQEAKTAEERARAEREKETATTAAKAGEQRSVFAQAGIEFRKGWDAARDAKAMGAFRHWLQSGEKKPSGDGAEELRALQEFRALEAGADVSGGVLVAPMEFVARLIIFVNNAVFIRQKATVLKVNTGASLGAPSLDADIDDADWTTELNTGNEDTGLKFGKRELYPHPLAKRVKISKRLLRIAALPVDQIVMSRMSYKFGISQEKGFLLGSGANQPLGMMVASNDGIPTSRDVSTANTTTAMTLDGLMNAKFSLKPQYYAKAEWMFHRDAVKNLMQIKDGDGQYIWSLSGNQTLGAPDRLLGSPVTMSEYMPNTFTSGLYVGLYGDFSNYWIADALDMQMQRLTELYAETNQDGFIGRMETDGMPVLAEAFARVKLA